MSIRVTCAQCGAQLKVKDELAGKKRPCPSCQGELVIPSADSDPAIAAVAASTKSSAASDDLDEAPALLSATSSTGTAKSKPKAKPKEEFDAADFLMNDDAEKPVLPVRTGRNAPNLDLIEEYARVQRSEPVMEAPTTAAPTKDGTAAATAAWDHAKVAKQMRKAIRQSNAEEREARRIESGESFDWSGAIQEVGIKGFGGILVIGIAAIAFYWVTNMAMGGGVKLPPLGYVTGTVTLNGQPLDGAMICFSPFSTDPQYEGVREPVRPSYGTTDAKGFYRMYYIDKHQGVAVGTCRVWLTRIGSDGREMVPVSFSENAMEIRNVNKGSQTINFDLMNPKLPGATAEPPKEDVQRKPTN